ncbi:unnamed protein product [Arctia plantaginis]|uniref:Uncharacterized protein n=1 Tax=Arctia plantaginis TaxID=874455 RepID=A0A8S0ZNG6_ARCPL|nr:unnamed protein product [Arctia plantaginis]
MYRMVHVAEEDPNFRRILWRFQQNEPVKHFELMRLTFGTAYAPYLAVKSLQRLSDDEQSKFIAAANITKSDVYMDDLITGEGQMRKYCLYMYKEMNKLINLGGFELQKWSSHDENVLKYNGQNKLIDHELLMIKKTRVNF